MPPAEKWAAPGETRRAGAPLARWEAPAAIGRLLERFSTIELDGDPADLRWRRRAVMHGLDRLPIRVGS